MIGVNPIPRGANYIANSLAKSDVMFNPPNSDHIFYSINVLHCALVLDNIKQWQVFEDDEQIKRFVTLIDEYSNMQIYFDEEEHEDIGGIGSQQLSNRVFPEIFDGKILV